LKPAERWRTLSASTDHPIREITLDDQIYNVTLRVSYDGVEYLGRLRFMDTGSGITFQDHAAVPGSSALDTVRRASEFSETEMAQRCYRALSEKRRFTKLRSTTDEIINKIRFLNRIAVGLEKGLIDEVGGKQELDQVQGELLDIVRTLKLHAGVEDEEPK
jgi:hypothetical protein